jgi:hypothetical protein
MAKLHNELGLPPDQPLSRVEMLTDPWFGKSWADWRYEAFGIFVSNDMWGPTARPPWPALRIEAEDEASAITLQAWLQYVWRNDSPLGIERRWHPVRGQRDHVTGLEHHHTAAQRTQVWRGLDLLNLVLDQQKPGAKPGDRVTEARALIEKTILLRKSGPRPSRETLRRQVNRTGVVSISTTVGLDDVIKRCRQEMFPWLSFEWLRTAPLDELQKQLESL